MSNQTHILQIDSDPIFSEMRDPDRDVILIDHTRNLLQFFQYLNNDQLLQISHSLLILLLNPGDQPSNPQFPLVFNSRDSQIHLQTTQFFSMFHPQKLPGILQLDNWDTSVFTRISYLIKS